MLTYLSIPVFNFPFDHLQVSKYLIEGLQRAIYSLNEVASLREKYVLGPLVTRRVAAAAASGV